jgi:four helix bundle protein
VNKLELEKRTMQCALRIIAFVATLPKNKAGDVVGYQLVKAGTSVGANYREANRAESRNDFIHKIAIVEKEASESQYWLKLCDEGKLGDVEQRRWLLQEAGELLAIFTRSGKTAKSNRAYAARVRS